MTSEFRNLVKRTALSLVYRLPPLPEQIHGKLVWVHPRARFSVSTRTFLKRESHVRKWVTQYIKQGYVFFDVGAHHGWFSMWALPTVGEQGEVYSFEPSPANLSILEWHKKNNHFSQWKIVPYAVSDEDSMESPFFLIDSGDSPMNSLTSGAPGMPLMDGRAINKILVQTITLDSFCFTFDVRPDLVKIDVEGAELAVLRGARKLISETSPVIILAVHPYWLPDGQSTSQIFEFLEVNDYTVFDSQGNNASYLRSGEYLCLNTKTESMSVL